MRAACSSFIGSLLLLFVSSPSRAQTPAAMAEGPPLTL